MQSSDPTSMRKKAASDEKKRGKGETLRPESRATRMKKRKRVAGAARCGWKRGEEERV